MTVRSTVREPGRRRRPEGGGARGYERWTKKDLYERAKELGIRDRSKLTKAELIRALRHGRRLPDPEGSTGTAAELGR
jgi:hypothetical protein